MEACWAHKPEVGRSKLPPANFLSRISVREETKTLTSQINKRESGEIYTSLPTNHNTRSRVLITLLRQQDGAVEACWAHNPEVGRPKLPPVNFLPRISVREETKTLTSPINKRESGENYTSLPTNHNTRSRVLITL